LDHGVSDLESLSHGELVELAREQAAVIERQNAQIQATAAQLSTLIEKFERALTWATPALAIPARRQRGHCPQPNGLLRRRRQLLYVPRQFTHAGSTPQSPYRFGSLWALLVLANTQGAR
jgi:hypothetical protein